MSDAEKTPTPLPHPESDAFAPTVGSDAGDAHGDGDDRLATEAAAHAISDGKTTERAGMIVGGKYRLLECIGEGGMGSVWRAEQHEPVKRTVAVTRCRRRDGVCAHAPPPRCWSWQTRPNSHAGEVPLYATAEPALDPDAPR